MAINASAGAQIFIGPTTAASDVSAYAALAWVEVSEVESLGEFGDQSEAIKFASLSDSRIRKLKGARDAGDLTLVVANDPRDAGQLALIAAEGTPFSYAVKIVIPDAPDSNDTDTILYFHSKVMSKRLGVGGVNDVTKRTFVLGIDTAIIESPSAAVS
jgi:hypothetical protein